jgi:hypothetical protein
MAPKDVTNKHVLQIIFRNIPKNTIPKYSVGDYVRISKKNIPFRKGYKPQFTNEIFKIVKVLGTNPPTYNLQDKDREVILGKFYEQELMKYVI